LLVSQGPGRNRQNEATIASAQWHSAMWPSLNRVAVKSENAATTDFAFNHDEQVRDPDPWRADDVDVIFEAANSGGLL